MVNRSLSPELIEYMKSQRVDKALSELAMLDSDSEKTKELKKTIEKMTEKTLSYDTNCPIPGRPVDIKTMNVDYSTNDLKADAEKTLITTAATHKLKKEMAAEHKRPIAERVKEYYINSIITHQKNEFFTKYGYEMSGGKIRNLKRLVINKYNKGQIKPTPTEYENIVAYLNSPLNDPNNKKVNPMKNNQSTSQQIGNLMSLI